MSIKKDYVMRSQEFKNEVPFFRTPGGDKILRMLIRLVKVEEINELYKSSLPNEGATFVRSILKDLDLKYSVRNPEALERLSDQGPFVIVSNHPYGAIDGMILIDLFGHIYPDFKVMVNHILSYIEAMRPNFISVEPNIRGNRSVSLIGMKQAIAQVRNGGVLGLFPAGAVSKLSANFRIEDREWQENIMRLIEQLNVPVVPVYFHGHNSIISDILGMIRWELRSGWLPREVLNKRGKTIRIVVGDAISVEEQHRYSTPKELGKFLRKKCYALKHLRT